MSDTNIKDPGAGAIMGAFIGDALAPGPRFKDWKPMKQKHADTQTER
jgi:hypothetical protein